MNMRLKYGTLDYRIMIMSISLERILVAHGIDGCNVDPRGPRGFYLGGYTAL